MKRLDCAVKVDSMTTMRHGHMSANEYLVNAVADIDAALGVGYAKKNPNLIATYLQVAHKEAAQADFTRDVFSMVDQVIDILVDSGILKDADWMMEPPIPSDA